jgi:hypothetical protein
LGPKRLVLREPFRKYVSIAPHRQSSPAIKPSGISR